MSLIRSSQIIVRSGLRPLLIAPVFGQRRFATQRPISPHVQIYDFPPTAISSITNRISGCMLAGSVTGLGFLGLVSSGDPAITVNGILNAAPLLAFPGKIFLTLPITYHWLSGLRHLVWDETLKGMTCDEAQTQTFIIAGGAILVSLFWATRSNSDEA